MMWYNWLIFVTRMMQVIAEEALSNAIFDVQPACPKCCHGTPLTAYSNVSSAIGCSELCTRYSVCQSWMFNLDNKTCRTNARTLNTVTTNCPNRILYGEKQLDPIQPYQFDPCNSSLDCQHLEHRACRQGRCHCADGRPYEPMTNSCPPSCKTYGETAHAVNYRLKREHIPVYINFNDMSISECARKCYRKIKTFTCLHFEHRTADRKCELFGATIVTSANVNGWTSWVRDCA